MMENKRVTKSRIMGEIVNIDDDTVKDYFNHRTDRKLPHRYNYVLNQDSHPEIAIERDKYEKKKMSRFLKLSSDAKVLDIGCGVGRWADEIINYLDRDKNCNGQYVGVDYSSELLKIARENFNSEKVSFLEGSFQELLNILKNSNRGGTYDRIFVNGVLQYINDKDIDLCFENINRVIGEHGIIYIKEAVGREDRFSLVNYYSEELKTNYNTIFRSVKEYSTKYYDFFLSKGFYIVTCGPTWENDLENRKESMSYYWIMER